MDFFEAQEFARKKSRLLVFYFLMAVVTIVIGVNLAAYFAFFFLAVEEGYQQTALPPLFDFERWFWISVVTVGIIAAGSLIRMGQMKAGGGYVARSVGGRRIHPTTRDPLERRLINVVEEMAIASGSPMPEVYILPHESAINAFAAGNKPTDAAIGVTRGALENLSRDELQGVIAHEFSHILNGDMRMNVRMIGILFGILMIALVGRILLHASGGRSSGRGKGGGAIVIFGLIVMILGFVGEFFGRLIQAAVSRQREYLADAAAVQFTRNPDGIAGALKTIGAVPVHGTIENQAASGMAHCFFASALSSQLGGGLATHPPLKKRIKAIQPNWDGRFPDLAKKRSQIQAAAATATPKKEEKGDDFIRRATMVAAIGAIGQGEVSAARKVMERIPESLSEAAHDPNGALALVLSLLLDPSDEQRQAQLRRIKSKVDASVYALVETLYPQVRNRPGSEQLPLVEMAIPSIQSGWGKDPRELNELIEQLVLADRKITLREFCIATLIEFRLAGEKPPHRPSESLPTALGRLLSKLVEVGESKPDHYREIYAAALEPLKGRIVTPPFVQPDSIVWLDLQRDLALVRRSPLPLRKVFLQACERAIRHDDQITASEADLFRLIALCIECPMPLVGPIVE